MVGTVVWHRATLATGLVLIGALALLALTAPWLGIQSPYDLDVAAMLEAPTKRHLLGTDELGRDLLSRTLHAGRTSLLVAAIAAGVGLIAGTTIGLVSAYFGGWIDLVLMRVMEVLFSFPAVLLAIVLMASLGTSLFNAMLAIGIVFIPGFARLARASAAVVLRESYIEAARAIGMGHFRIMRREILPNITAPLLAETAVALSYAILLESALSFLGLGAQPPEPSWGNMLNTGRGFMSQAPWLSVVPGMAIFMTVLSFNLVADGLRDKHDPRLRS